MLAETQADVWLRRRHTDPRVVEEDWGKAHSVPRRDDWKKHTVLKFRPREEVSAAQEEPVNEQHLKNLEAARLLAQWQTEGSDEEVALWLEFDAKLEEMTRG